MNWMGTSKMIPTPFSRSCNKTIRAFYEDFDMLPREFKEMLWNNPTSPDFDDLKAAWELASAETSLKDLINRVNVLKPSKEELARLHRLEKERKKEEIRNKKRKYYEFRPILGAPRLKDDPKHARFVQRVSDEEAMRLLARRKENKDVVAYTPYISPIIGYEKVMVVIDPNTIPPEKFEKPQHIAKMMHNAGGKK